MSLVMGYLPSGRRDQGINERLMLKNRLFFDKYDNVDGFNFFCLGNTESSKFKQQAAAAAIFLLRQCSVSVDRFFSKNFRK